jgi:hypothetical protein
MVLSHSRLSSANLLTQKLTQRFGVKGPHAIRSRMQFAPVEFRMLASDSCLLHFRTGNWALV